jgi:hypothetical protein
MRKREKRGHTHPTQVICNCPRRGASRAKRPLLAISSFLKDCNAVNSWVLIAGVHDPIEQDKAIILAQEIIMTTHTIKAEHTPLYLRECLSLLSLSLSPTRSLSLLGLDKVVPGGSPFISPVSANWAYIRVIRKVTLSSPCLWGLLSPPLSSLSVISAK